MNSSQPHFLEENLYGPVRAHLQARGFTVRGEVASCDLAAEKDGMLVVVELKRGLTMDLLMQGVKRQKAADLVYLGIPRPRRRQFTRKWNDIVHLLRRLELGLLLVSFRGGESLVEEAVEPAPFDRAASVARAKKMRSRILKEMAGRNADLNTGGSRGRKLVTAYRESALFIACALRQCGPLSPKQLRALGTEPGKTLSILNQNFYGWFERQSRGIYALSPAGVKGLEKFSGLVEHYERVLAGGPLGV